MSKSSRAAVVREVAAVEESMTDPSQAFGIQLLWDYILVKAPERSERTAGGGVVILPGLGMDKNEAIILAVGPGVLHDGKKVPMPFEVGDRVVLANANYHPIAVEGAGDMLLVKAGLVLCKVVGSDSVLLNAGGKKDYAAAYQAHHVDED